MNEELVARIKALCKERGTSCTKIEFEHAWGNGAIGKWAKLKSLPPLDRLQIVAERLGVTVEYLLTGNENKPTPEGEPMSLEALRSLSKEELYELMNNVVKALKEKE